MNTAKMLVKGLGLELPDKLTRYIRDKLDTTCCITGERIEIGIPWKRVIPSSTAEYLDLMSGMTFEYMSLPAAAAYKGSFNLGSRLMFEDGSAYHPYIASSSAKRSERTYWSALVRHVWPERRGQRCLCIVAGDFKKRVWPRARCGPLGINTPVLLFDPDRFVLDSVVVDWERLIDVLDFVEEVYTAGFSKRAIDGSLYSDYSTLTERPSQAMEWEQLLTEIRDTPEFGVSILIAQKGA